jgi:hypothetical protein
MQKMDREREKIVAQISAKEVERQGEEEMAFLLQPPPPPPPEPSSGGNVLTMPLLDYLCAYMECTLKELQVLFNNLEARRRMLYHLRNGCQLSSNHLRPVERNIPLHAHDMSAQNANMALACGGYLDITVRQYYYIKHGRRLKHPYMPCMIEFGGGQHASYYPLEVIQVHISKSPTPASVWPYCVKREEPQKNENATNTPKFCTCQSPT